MFVYRVCVCVCLRMPRYARRQSIIIGFPKGQQTYTRAAHAMKRWYDGTLRHEWVSSIIEMQHEILIYLRVCVWYLHFSFTAARKII